MLCGSVERMHTIKNSRANVHRCQCKHFVHSLLCHWHLPPGNPSPPRRAPRWDWIQSQISIGVAAKRVQQWVLEKWKGECPQQKALNSETCMNMAARTLCENLARPRSREQWDWSWLDSQTLNSVKFSHSLSQAGVKSTNLLFLVSNTIPRPHARWKDEKKNRLVNGKKQHSKKDQFQWFVDFMV